MKTQHQRPLRNLLPFVLPHGLMIGISTLLRSINLFLGIGLFGLCGYGLANLVVKNQQPSTGFWLLLIGLGLVKAGARYGEQITGHTAAFRILHTLRQQLFNGFTNQPLDKLGQERTGDLVTRAMADVELVEIFFAHTLAPGITAGLFLVTAGITTSMLIHPFIGSSLIGLYLLAGIIIPVLFQRGLLGTGKKNRQVMGSMSSEAQEYLGGLVDLLAYGTTESTISLINRIAKTAYRSMMSLSLISGFRDMLVDGLLLTSLGLILYGGFILFPTNIDPALVWGIATGLAGGFGAILGINRAVDDLPKTSAAATRILEIIQFQHPSTPSIATQSVVPAVRPSSSSPLSSGGRTFLHAQGLTFLYESGGGIKDLHFTVQSGEQVFLSGRSGAGKTTLISLILGFLVPQEGSITLEGKDLASMAPEQRFHLISAARQNNLLIRGTVQDNLNLGLEHDSQPFPGHALEIPEIQALFDQLPQGGSTQTGGTDEQVSGGQRRRIVLSAALAKQPQILILDEAFAGLDQQLKNRIRSNLFQWARLHRISIIEISHELEDAKDADRILVLEQGRLVEEGTYSQLIQQEGLFWDLLSN
jgi:ABC-type multidrug transport system fused ATPase/permease subunit